MTRLVSLERRSERVALVSVTNPAIRNHGSWACVDELGSVLAEAREGGASVCVLASGVPGHWLEHAWLPDLCNMVDGEPTSGTGVGWFTILQELTHPDVVSIAAITGDCSGGGAEIAWACDLRVAEEQVRLAQPEVMLGLSTGLGGSSRLLRLVGRTVAAEMVLDGAPLAAERLYGLGAINRIAAEAGGLELALAWAERIASRPRAALRTLKRALAAAQDLPLAEALANEQRLFQAVARSDEARSRMRATQARFEAGESIREVYGPPQD